MASHPVARAKVRSRRDGSAVPLDETDKKLLNLMQGSFALCEQPFATWPASPASRNQR